MKRFATLFLPWFSLGYSLAFLFASLTATAQQPAAIQAAQGKVVVGGNTYATGWVKDPAATQRVLNRLVRQGKEPTFEKAAPKILQRSADTNPVFYWHSEKKVLGKVLPSWNQGQVGSCVGFGFGRAVQDVLLNEVASGQAEKWPGSEQTPEVIYGGSRVEVGGGGIDGDGSIGGWAAEWVKDYGTINRGKYGTLDLTTYNEATCRKLGDQGIPADLEELVKQHPITEIALVTTADGLWSALGAGKGVPPCSMQGFTTSRDADGYCRLSGSWAHCMEYRGRFVHPTRGKSVIIQNSWGNYLGSGNAKFKYVDSDGTTKEETLPEGSFCVELNMAAGALRDRDTFVLAGLKGWEASPPPPPGPTPPTPPQPPVPPVPGKPVVVTVDGISVTLDFTNKKAQLPPGWTTNLFPPPQTLTEQLAGKGLTAAQIDLVLKLIDLFSLAPLPQMNSVAQPAAPTYSAPESQCVGENCGAQSHRTPPLRERFLQPFDGRFAPFGGRFRR